jgi:hypothetical protein
LPHVVAESARGVPSRSPTTWAFAAEPGPEPLADAPAPAPPTPGPKGPTYDPEALWAVYQREGGLRPAARALGMAYNTLKYRLEKHGYLQRTGG